MAHVCHRPATNRFHHAIGETQTDVPNQRQTRCYQNRLKQMPRATALDLCEDYREVVTRLKRMADNLAGAFVVASGDSARAW